jgi:hypothetical protein
MVKNAYLITDNSGVIYEDDIIYFPNGDSLAARDLTTEHDGAYILDPIEPEQANAVLNVSVTGVKTIHSFLHGGRTFDIVPADLDTKLTISKEAKNLAQSFLKNNEMTSINHTGSERRFLMQRLIFDVSTIRRKLLTSETRLKQILRKLLHMQDIQQKKKSISLMILMILT